MSTNTTKPIENTKPPFGSKAWWLQSYLVVLYAIFVVLGYAIRNIINLNQPWILEFNQFMASICYQVAAIAEFETHVVMNQFYFGIMWVIGSLVMPPMMIAYQRSKKQTHTYAGIFGLFVGSIALFAVPFSSIMLKKKGYLFLILNSDWFSPFVASVVVLGTQMFLFGSVYFFYLLVKNFKRFILGANDVR